MRLRRNRKYNTFLSNPTRAFTRVRAVGSLAREIYPKDGEASVIAGASLSVTPLGKQKKEPRLFFIPTFQKEKSGFYSFTGFKLKIEGGNHED